MGVLGQPEARGERASRRPAGSMCGRRARPHCVRSAHDDAFHVHQRRLLGGRPQRVRGLAGRAPGPRAAASRSPTTWPARRSSRARRSTGRTRRATAPSRAARTRPRPRSPGAPWRRRAAAAPGWRADALRRALRAPARGRRAGIGERHLELAAVASLEVGKTRAESIAEVQEAIDLIEAYAGHMEANDGYVQPLEAWVDGRAQHRRPAPLRHVRRARAVQLPGGAVVRHDRRGAHRGQHRRLQALGGDAVDGRDPRRDLRRRGLPAGVFNLVQGGPETGRALVAGEIDGVAFTGSAEVGRAIARTLQEGRYARPALTEMGGKNPAIVTATADLDAAAEGIARAAFGLSGQKCSACSRAIVRRRRARRARRAARRLHGDAAARATRPSGTRSSARWSTRARSRASRTPSRRPRRRAGSRRAAAARPACRGTSSRRPSSATCRAATGSSARSCSCRSSP